MISAAYAVRSANGNRKLQAVGIAETAVIPNIFSTPAALIGTLLKPKENVPVVCINGETHLVFTAVNGLCMKIGTARN